MLLGGGSSTGIGLVPAGGSGSIPHLCSHNYPFYIINYPFYIINHYPTPAPCPCSHSHIFTLSFEYSSKTDENTVRQQLQDQSILIQQFQIIKTMTSQSRISMRSNKMSEVGSILTIDQKDPLHQKLGPHSKRQVEEWLEAEAKLLIDKKQRQRQKQNRLKALEDQFQKKRSEKYKQIDQKLVSSSLNKRKNLKNIQKKLSDGSKRYNSVLNKFQYEQEKLKQKWYNQRKTFDVDTFKPASKMSHMSRSSEMPRSKKQSKEQVQNQQIQKLMQEINSKLEKANSNKKKRHSQFYQKIHLHNTSELEKHQLKANQQLSQQVSGYGKKIASKIENAENNKKKQEQSLQKKLEYRQKAYSDKLRAYQDNLRNLQSKHLARMEQLNKKFQNIQKVNKSWHNQKDQINHKRFLNNLSVLEQRKVLRADRILQKHQQITAKNKVYRQRQHSLISAIKCNPSNY